MLSSSTLSALASIPNLGTIVSPKHAWFGVPGKRGTFPKDTNSKEVLYLTAFGKVSSAQFKMQPDGSFNKAYPPSSIPDLHWRFLLTATGDDDGADEVFDKTVTALKALQKREAGNDVANLVTNVNGQVGIRMKRVMYHPVSTYASH